MNVSARRARAIACALAVGIGVVAGPAQAQRAGVSVQLAGSLGLNDSLIVSVLTMGQGQELFDRFGHIAIRVRNPFTGLDSAWNWGMYDFNSPNFIPRFLTGETRYWMAGYPSPLFIDYYRREGRAVWEQVLDLDRHEADSLLKVLRWQARDENKFYRYDYYLDNCSTRVRDAIDAVLGGGLKQKLNGAGHGVTWRGETLRLSAGFPAIAFGMTFALGPRADATISQWDELFIPMRLRDAIRGVAVTRASGERPLVRGEQLLTPEGQFIEAASPPSSLNWAVILGLILAGLIGAVGSRMDSAKSARVAFGVVAALWHLVAGFAGTLVLWAGLFTRHAFMASNTSVLLGTPASLVLAVLIPVALLTRSSARLRGATVALSVFAAAASLVAVLGYFASSGTPRDLAPSLFAIQLHAVVAVSLFRSRRGEAAA